MNVRVGGLWALGVLSHPAPPTSSPPWIRCTITQKRGEAQRARSAALYIQLLGGARTPFTPEPCTAEGPARTAARAALDSTTRTTLPPPPLIVWIIFLNVSLLLDERRRKIKVAQVYATFSSKEKEQHLSVQGQRARFCLRWRTSAARAWLVSWNCLTRASGAMSRCSAGLALQDQWAQEATSQPSLVLPVPSRYSTVSCSDRFFFLPRGGWLRILWSQERLGGSYTAAAHFSCSGLPLN